VDDWQEWRANEFMGAFLAPKDLLREYLLRVAVDLRLPLVGEGPIDLPVLDGRRAGHDEVEALAVELADLFGLSLPFIQVRLEKYRLIARC